MSREETAPAGAQREGFLEEGALWDQCGGQLGKRPGQEELSEEAAQGNRQCPHPESPGPSRKCSSLRRGAHRRSDLAGGGGAASRVCYVQISDAQHGFFRWSWFFSSLFLRL